MKTIRRAIVLAIFATLSCAAFPARAQVTEVAVIVSESNATDSLSLGELRKVFMGERRSWAVGLPIKLIVRDAGTREHKAMLRLMGMSEREYKEYWIAQIFRGEVDSEPLSLPTLLLQWKAVTIFRGGITLVDSKDVKPDMKVLKVNGRLPGEPAYPLH